MTTRKQLESFMAARPDIREALDAWSSGADVRAPRLAGRDVGIYELARLLGVAAPTLWRWMARGRLPPSRIGGGARGTARVFAGSALEAAWPRLAAYVRAGRPMARKGRGR